MRLIVPGLVLLMGTAQAQLPHVNWENHPVHGMDISPDRRTLAVAHTADRRAQLYDISEGRAVRIGHVAVGLDPVSVRFRTDREAWVINHVSDSVSVIDIERRAVIATLQTRDEPADVVFAGSPQRAFVTCSQANLVMVFDPAELDATPTIIPIDGEDPRALAVGANGSTVYAAIFESGNGTTILGGGADELDTISYPP